MAMLRETQWVVVMGTKGTCKTSLAAGLARHLALCVSGDDEGQVRSASTWTSLGGRYV